MEKLDTSVSVVRECWEVFASLLVVQPKAVHLTCAMGLRVDFARGHLLLGILVQVAKLRIHMVATVWVLLVYGFAAFHTEVA